MNRIKYYQLQFNFEINFFINILLFSNPIIDYLNMNTYNVYLTN